MKTLIFKASLFGLIGIFCCCGKAEAQLLRKLKQKANEVSNKVIDKKVDDAIDNNTGTSSDNRSSNGNRSGKPTNRTGAGLTNTAPPDVKQKMTEAEQAFGSSKYSEARYSIQQALMGVEIQLGRKLLKSLPTEVNSLAADTAQDRVVSTQWGWTNMTIQRVYKTGEDKQLTVMIGNAGLYAGLVNIYFNSAYVQADGQQQNVKQVKVKGYKAIIQFDESTGYTLIVPIGQSSMIAWECVNFADENEVMNAAEKFDIDGIKKTLGEQ